MIVAISTRRGDLIRFAWLVLISFVSIAGQERNAKIRILGMASWKNRFGAIVQKPSSVSVFASCYRGLPKPKAASTRCEKLILFIPVNAITFLR